MNTPTNTMASTTAGAEPRYDVLWPLSRKAVERTSAAPRLPDLNGKTVGMLWDGIFRGQIIYPLVREYIQSRFPQVKFVDHSAFGNFHGAREYPVIAALPDKLREQGCDAAIVGIGA
jgi:hypothetical protein